MSFSRFCLSGLVALAGMAAMAATPSSPAASVTFNKDVLPILQENCQGCHRPGEVAPMSLLGYSDARPWAKSIKAAVASKKMPPWFADRAFDGHFTDQKTLTDAQIATVVSWVDNGSPEGDAKDKPAPKTFYEGWNIRPDVIVKMPKAFVLPTNGTIPYKHILVKANFPEDMWVTAAEMRPGNPKVVHHGKVWVRPPGSKWMEDSIPGEAYDTGTAARKEGAPNESRGGRKMGEAQETDILAKFNPGLGAQEFNIEGAAKFIPKGSDLVFELHYTADGKDETDVSEVGLTVTKTAPVSRKYFYTSGPSAGNLVLRPNDGNAEVAAEATVGLDDVKLVYMQPHMHLRGKDMEVRAIYPTGEMQTLLKVKFDFNWQEGYQLKEPIPLPKGTRLISILHYDNSANNAYNPDPSQEVHWGEQNWEEMGNLFVGVTMNLKDDGGLVFHKTGASLLKPAIGVGGPHITDLHLPTMTASK
jgi:mono/diheme cytochrome c family protein